MLAKVNVPASREGSLRSAPSADPRLSRHQYGIADLQALAFDAIQSRLSPKNIVQEVFSRFTSR